MSCLPWIEFILLLFSLDEASLLLYILICEDILFILSGSTFMEFLLFLLLFFLYLLNIILLDMLLLEILLYEIFSLVLLLL